MKSCRGLKVAVFALLMTSFTTNDAFSYIPLKWKLTHWGKIWGTARYCPFGGCCCVGSIGPGRPNASEISAGYGEMASEVVTDPANPSGLALHLRFESLPTFDPGNPDIAIQEPFRLSAQIANSLGHNCVTLLPGQYPYVTSESTYGDLYLSAVVDQPVSADDAACRSAIYKRASKLAKTVNKTIDACLKAVIAGKLPSFTRCNDVVEADIKGKVAGAIGKLSAGIAASCDSARNPTLIATSYANCPAPADAADGAGATTAVDSFAELNGCQAALNTDGIEPLRRHILQPDAAGIGMSPNASGIAACGNTIAKGATRLWGTVSKARGKCQADSDKFCGPYAYACSDAAGDTIADAVTDFQNDISAACAGLTGGELGLLGSCDSTVPGLRSCVPAAVEKNAGGITATAFAFAGVCPSKARVVVNAGTGVGTTPTQHLNRTELDLGWVGFAHDGDLSDGFVEEVNLDCSSNDDCATCSVTTSCDAHNCRCANDSSIECSTPFATGGPCGPNLCLVHVGPPLPLMTAPPVCIVNTLAAERVGTTNVGTGESTSASIQTAKVYLGVSATQPCPICTGSSIGAAGVCTGGVRNALACTTAALHPTIGGTSYECPPSPASNVSGTGLTIDLTLTSNSSSLAFGDACDAPLGTLSCACGACSGDATLTCRTDTDCTSMGAGTCTNAGGALRKPNDCSDLTCSALGSGEGACASAPDDTFCDGYTKADGEGYLPCSANSDCTALGAGTCSKSKRRPCFLNPIEAAGVAGSDGAELVSTFCAPATSSPSVNSAIGLPGPGRVIVDVDYTRFCSDGTTEFQLSGANCP
jgi:hypothetical protein